MDLCILYLLNFVFQILPLQPMTKHFEDIQNLPRRSFLKAVIFSQDMRQAPFNYIFGLKHLTMHADLQRHRTMPGVLLLGKKMPERLW